MSAFLIGYNIIPQEQFGFRTDSGTETALLKLFDQLAASANDRKISGVLALDFSKAFDTVPHDKLLNAVASFAEPNALAFVKSFLEDRSQCVRVNGVTTPWRQVSQGVPQGSRLSPLLFSLFVAPLATVIQRTKLEQYADDCNLYVSCDFEEGVIRALEEDFVRVKAWSTENGLTLNEAKTEFVLVRGRTRDTAAATLVVGATRITEAENIKILGFYLNNKLSYRKHLEVTKQKAIGGLAALSAARAKLTKPLCRKFYIAMIRSRIEYCSILTELLATDTEKAELEKIQTRAVRLISHGRQFPTDRDGRPLVGISRDCRKRNNLDLLSTRRKIRVLKLGCNIINDKCHPAISDLLSRQLPVDRSRFWTKTMLHNFTSIVDS
jgi:hypothetical protein